MFSLIRKRMRGGKGFTLIELLVVIIIIAILAAIAIPTFLNQRAKAQDTNAKSLIRNAMMSVESSYADTNDFSAITVGDLTNDEPSIVWVDGTAEATVLAIDATGPQAEDDSVLFASDTENTYALSTWSASGKAFSVQVDKNVGGGNTFLPADAW